LYKVLSDYDLKILHAHDGQQVIDKTFENDNVDLILMDLKMPKIDGLEATKIIKERKPSIPIIAQTAYATPADQQASYDSGCDAYISKPIEASRLIQLVKRFLSKNSPG
ncbi:response regulator, partial [Marinilabilia sp.]